MKISGKLWRLEHDWVDEFLQPRAVCGLICWYCVCCLLVSKSWHPNHGNPYSACWMIISEIHILFKIKLERIDHILIDSWIFQLKYRHWAKLNFPIISKTGKQFNLISNTNCEHENWRLFHIILKALLNYPFKIRPAHQALSKRQTVPSALAVKKKKKTKKKHETCAKHINELSEHPFTCLNSCVQ